mgnify:CR=1 FL=1
MLQKKCSKNERKILYWKKKKKNFPKENFFGTCEKILFDKLLFDKTGSMKMRYGVQFFVLLRLFKTHYLSKHPTTFALIIYLVCAIKE